MATEGRGAAGVDKASALGTEGSAGIDLAKRLFKGSFAATGASSMGSGDRGDDLARAWGAGSSTFIATMVALQK